MNEPDKKEDDFKFQQFALFGIIVSEMVITPALLGGGAYYLTRGKAHSEIISLLAALVGIAIAFYRIWLFQKNRKQN